MENIGKKKCEILKGIRKEIARSEGIAYAPEKCTHEGDCPGTCPRCEAEVQYLEQEIARKHGRSLRPAAAVVGGLLSASSLVSCGGVPAGYPLDSVELCVDSEMVGTEREFSVLIDTDGESSSWRSVKVAITPEMVGENYVEPDSGSVLWQAIEDAKAQQLKK